MILSSKNRLDCLIVFIGFVYLSLAIIYGLRGGVPWNSDGGAYYSHLASRFEHNSMNIAWVQDASIPIQDTVHFYQIIGKSGDPVVKYNPTFATLWAPIYLAAQLVERDSYGPIHRWIFLTVPALFIPIGLWFLKKWLGTYLKEERLIFLTLIAFAFATPALYYGSIQSLSAHPTLFLLMASILFLTTLPATPSRGLLIGLLLGGAVAARPTSALMIFFLALPSAPWVLIGSLIAHLPAFQYNYYVFGHPLQLGYPGEGFTSPRFLEWLFSIQNGVLLYTPLLALSVAGIPLLWRNHREVLYKSIMVLAPLSLLLCSWWYWTAGLGCRWLIDAYPILALPLALSFEKLMKFRILPLLLTVLILYQICLIGLYQRGHLQTWRMTWKAVPHLLESKSERERYLLPNDPPSDQGLPLQKWILHCLLKVPITDVSH